MSIFHSHRFKVTGAHPLDRVTRHQLLGELRSPVTEVLKVCDCGHVKTETLEGHWTLEQLQPESSKADADRTYLKHMGVKL